jgi:hypothetical protein
MEPKPRQRLLLDCRMDGGLLVYDHERNEAHYLNRTAAVIWKHCDGRNGIPELAALLPNECQLPADEGLVCFALKRLDAARLLQEPLQGGYPVSAVTRRQVVRRLGLVGSLSVLLPTVSSVLVPSAAWAVSATEPGGTCNCQVDRQPPGPSTSCSDGNKGARATTSSTGTCLGTAKNCSGNCTLTATWECQGVDAGWLLVGRSNDCPKPS